MSTVVCPVLADPNRAPIRCVWAALLMAALLAVLAGCASAARGGPATFASVVIRDRTMDEIRRAAATVFTANFYVTKLSGQDIMVFEKMGSAMDNLAYGGWARNQVALRVKLYLTPAGDSAYLVSANAFVVRDPGDTAIEDEQPLPRWRRGPYQRLLNDIQTQLDRTVPAVPESGQHTDAPSPQLR